MRSILTSLSDRCWPTLQNAAGASPLGARSARHRSKILLVAHVSDIFCQLH